MTTTVQSVLLVEDDTITASIITELLNDQGLETEWSSDGLQGLSRAVCGKHDLIILDQQLPTMDGREICRKLRDEAHVHTPVMILTAEAALESRLASFTVGADDHLAKPFQGRELVARARALIRRSQPFLLQDAFSVGDLRLDLQTRHVDRAGRKISLTNKDFDLLSHLMRSYPRSLTREELTELMWGTIDASRYSNVLRQHMHTLRRAVDQSSTHKMIRNMPGRRVGLVAEQLW